jgi:hypothetical protein
MTVRSILSKKGYSFIFYGAGCTERMKLDLSQASYFTNAIVSEEDTYAAVYATTPKAKSNCFYSRNRLRIEKYSEFMDDCSGNVLVKS